MQPTVKKLIVSLVASASLAALTAGVASGQVADPGTSTTEATVTTLASVESSTTVAPVESSTTVAPVPTDVTTTTLGVVETAGAKVTAGQLSLGTEFEKKTDANCTAEGTLAGGGLNVYTDEDNKIGAFYGLATLGGNQIAVATVELGPLPLAITAYRSMGPCNVDVIGIGNYSATANTATLDGIGYGAFPGDYANKLTQTLTVDTTTTPADLDLAAVKALLEQERPPVDPPAGS